MGNGYDICDWIQVMPEKLFIKTVLPTGVVINHVLLLSIWNVLNLNLDKL